jgi:hypothetical protein
MQILTAFAFVTNRLNILRQAAGLGRRSIFDRVDANGAHVCIEHAGDALTVEHN